MNEVLIVLYLAAACGASVWLGKEVLMHYPANPSDKNDFVDWWLKTESREAWGRVFMSVFMHAFLWMFLKEWPFVKGGYFASLLLMLCRQLWLVASGIFGKARTKAIEDYESWHKSRR